MADALEQARALRRRVHHARRSPPKQELLAALNRLIASLERLQKKNAAFAAEPEMPPPARECAEGEWLRKRAAELREARTAILAAALDPETEEAEGDACGMADDAAMFERIASMLAAPATAEAPPLTRVSADMDPEAPPPAEPSDECAAIAPTSRAVCELPAGHAGHHRAGIAGSYRWAEPAPSNELREAVQQAIEQMRSAARYMHDVPNRNHPNRIRTIADALFAALAGEEQ